jgi:hypothetical protein
MGITTGICVVVLVFLLRLLRLLFLRLTLIVPLVLLFLLVPTFVSRHPACRLDELEAFFAVICAFAQFCLNLGPGIVGGLHVHEGLVLFCSERGGNLGLLFLFLGGSVIEQFHQTSSVFNCLYNRICDYLLRCRLLGRWLILLLFRRHFCNVGSGETRSASAGELASTTIASSPFEKTARLSSVSIGRKLVIEESVSHLGERASAR